MKYFIALFFSLISITTYGQDVTIDRNNDKKHVSVSTSFVGGRYEIIMSDIIARHAFKVDKYTGNVYQLVEIKDGYLTWELLYRDKASNDVQIANKINYQLYMSGLAVRFVFLINVNTGITWQLVKAGETDNTLSFELIQ